MVEYDQILDDEHTKLLQDQQYPSDSQFIWHNVSKKNKFLFKINFFFWKLNSDWIRKKSLYTNNKRNSRRN